MNEVRNTRFVVQLAVLSAAIVIAMGVIMTHGNPLNSWWQAEVANPLAHSINPHPSIARSDVDRTVGADVSILVAAAASAATMVATLYFGLLFWLKLAICRRQSAPIMPAAPESVAPFGLRAWAAEFQLAGLWAVYWFVRHQALPHGRSLWNSAYPYAVTSNDSGVRAVQMTVLGLIAAIIVNAVMIAVIWSWCYGVNGVGYALSHEPRCYPPYMWQDYKYRFNRMPRLIRE